MTIVVRTLSEQIYALIRDRLVSGELPLGTPIHQDALAKELGVSKIPLREAFARLERDGLLMSITNRGFFVPPLSMDEAEEVYALRLKIEPEAVAQAAKLATEKDHQLAREALKALEDEKTHNPALLSKLHRAYHMALIMPCKQKIVVQLAERLHTVAERYVNKHLEPTGRAKRAKREHMSIYEAWSAGQARAVKSMMHEHLSSTLDDLRKQFEEKAPAL